jgi:hypothetical protein
MLHGVEHEQRIMGLGITFAQATPEILRLECSSCSVPRINVRETQ